MVFDPDIQKRIHPYKPPAAGFDPLTASDRALEENGLPPRPPAAAREQMDFWRELMSPPLVLLEPKFGPPVSPPKVAAKPTLMAKAAARPAGGAPRRVFAGRGHVENSRNWSGAYLQRPIGQKFTFVAGSWTVPTPSVPTVPPVAGDPDDIFRDQYRSSTWVGLGGHRSYPHVSMPQLGTKQYVKMVGGVPTVELGAWWQWWSTHDGIDEMPIDNIPVAPGHRVLASILVVSADEVIYYMKNQTTGAFTWFLVQAPPDSEPIGATAEWVVERPTWPQATFPSRMPKLTDVTFTHCIALSGPRIIGPQTLHRLDEARFIRMQERFDTPSRSALISMPTRLGPTSLGVAYREAFTT